MYAKEVELALNEIRDAIKDKDKTLAIEKCQSLLKEDPKNYVCLVLLGTIYQTTNKAHAILHLRKAVGCSDKPTRALKELAKCVPVDDLPQIYEKLLLLIPANAFEYYGKLAMVGASNPTVRQKCIEILKNAALDAKTTYAERSSYLSLAKIWVLQDEIDEADQELFNSCLEVAMADSSNPELQLDSLKRYLKELYKLKDYANLISKADYMFDLYPYEPCSLEWICKLYSELNKTNSELISVLPLPIDFYAQKLEELSPKSSLATKTRSVIKAVDSEVQAKATTITEKIPDPKSVVRANSSTPTAAVSAHRSKVDAIAKVVVSPASASKFTQGAHPKSLVRANSSTLAAAVSADRAKADATANAGVSPDTACRTVDSAQCDPQHCHGLGIPDAPKTAKESKARIAGQQAPQQLISSSTSKYRQRANAKKLLRRLKKKDPLSYTEKDNEALAWAKELVGPAADRSEVGQAKAPSAHASGWASCRVAAARKGGLPPPTSVAGRTSQSSTAAGKERESKPKVVAGCSKRGRHDETISPSLPGSKRARTDAEIVKGNLRVAIVDYGNPERKLTNEQWKSLEIRILDGVNEALLKGTEPFPLFGQLTTFKGFKVMECDDGNTLTWLKEFMTDTKAPWANADLRVIEKKELISLTRPKGRLLLTDPYLPKDIIERNLRLLNPELLSNDWEVIEVGEHTETGMEVTILLSHRSMALLRDGNFKARVGIPRCTIRPLGKDEGSNCNDEGDTNKPSS